MVRSCIGLTLFALCIGNVKAQDVTIHITGPGPNAKFIREGDTAQLPVSVAVGQTVRFANDQGTTTTHNATERDPANPTRPPLFRTDDLTVGNSKDVLLDSAMFTAAGGIPGGSVELNYLCTRHPSLMKSKIILTDTQTVVPPIGDGTHETFRRRRDITTLSSDELTAYRDAWRRIQQDGTFKRIAGNHGCPDRYCHRAGEDITFLAWHREYLIQLESALGLPLHYWNWNSPSAAASGIPILFTEPTYVSGTSTYPNSLRTFRFECPAGTAAQSTARAPRQPFLLAQYAAAVRNAYFAATYADINSLLENPPHDSVHGWIGGNMGAVFTAAYDPIFWAHHSNVDRQWASWQRGGGAGPLPSELAFPLTGFSGRTVANVVAISALGYEYDSYDDMPVQPSEAMSAQVAGVAKGVGKTFDLPQSELESPAAAADRPRTLVVSGLSQHPRESYFVYVFVNQPNAKIEDARPENPNFAGTFAVFGGAGEGADHEARAATIDKPVMELFAGKKPTVQVIQQVTLITTDEKGGIVSSEVVPFSAVRLQAATLPDARALSAAQRPSGSEAQAQMFTGSSANESFDDAYRDAMTKAQAALNVGADRIVKSKLVSVEGQRGGITGQSTLVVTVQAWLE